MIRLLFGLKSRKWTISSQETVLSGKLTGKIRLGRPYLGAYLPLKDNFSLIK